MRLLTFAILSAFALCSLGASTPDEKSPEKQPELGKWDGFRGIKWGTDLKSLTGFAAFSSVIETGNYRRKDEKLTLGSVPLQEIRWQFYKGKLYHVLITGEDGTFSSLKTETVKRYGKTYKDTSDKLNEDYTWSGKNSDGEKVTVQVTRERQFGMVLVYFTYWPLEEQFFKEKGKENAEELDSWLRQYRHNAKETAAREEKPDW